MGWFEDMEQAEQEHEAMLEDEARAYKEGYEQGRADAFKEIAYSDVVIKEPFEKLAYEKGRADERARLLAQADCDVCWECAMADGDMNCILKGQSMSEVLPSMEELLNRAYEQGKADYEAEAEKLFEDNPPMHFNREQIMWIKEYIKQARADERANVFDEVLALSERYDMQDAGIHCDIVFRRAIEKLKEQSHEKD